MVHILITYENKVWAPQFSDSSKKTVKAEQRDSYKGITAVIVSLKQWDKTELDAIITKLNNGIH